MMKPEQYTILIVDDNTTNLSVVSNYLEESGFRVMTARNGQRGLAIAERGQPHLILLDGLMPDMDGFETCQQLKANPATQAIPVIFMTALTDEAWKVKGFEVGAVDYVTKPIQQQELLMRINTHLRLYKQARWLQAQNLRLEMSQEVSQRITSILDSDKLLAEVVQLLQVKFSYFFVGVWLFQAEQHLLTLKASAPTHWPGCIRLEEKPTIVAQVYRSGQLYLANQATHDPLYQPMVAETQAQLALPLTIQGQIQGVLDVQSQYSEAFTPEDVVALQLMINQIDLALTNSRLFQQTQVALRETQGLFKAAQAILGAADLEVICRNLITEFYYLINAQGISVYLVDHEQRQVTLSFEQQNTQFLVSDHVQYQDLEAGIAGMVFRSKQPILSLNADDGIEPAATKEIRKLRGVGAIIVAPLIAKGSVIGIITAVNFAGQRLFTPHDVDLLMALTTQAAAALENVRLFHEAQAARAVAEQNREIAEAANRAKSVFLANMSHELRTPLNAVLGFSQLLQRDNQLMPRQTEKLRIINRSGEHLLSLINDVLEMSKIEAGRVVVQETVFNLPDLLADMEAMFGLRAQEKGLTLRFEGAADLPAYVQTDVSKLRQIFINLLGNAVKFTARGSIVLRGQVIKTPAADSPITLRFEVEDTGYGIHETELAQLFEPFSQTESGRNSQQGTGLGLAISRQFARLMGGDLTVNSQLGVGSCFQVTFPVTHWQFASPVVTEAKRVVGLVEGHAPYRVLVVEDRADNRIWLAELLQQVGFQVRTSAHGQEALGEWREWQPHCVLLDLRMPVMDGYETARQLRAQDTTTIIIALTAGAFEEDRVRALAVGCNDFLRKPIREAELLEVLAQHAPIQYRYMELHAPASPATTSPMALPQSLLTQLYEAALMGYYEGLVALAGEVRRFDEGLGQQVWQWVENFENDQILAWVESLSTERRTLPPPSPFKGEGV